MPSSLTKPLASMPAPRDTQLSRRSLTVKNRFGSHAKASSVLKSSAKHNHSNHPLRSRTRRPSPEENLRFVHFATLVVNTEPKRSDLKPLRSPVTEGNERLNPANDCTEPKTSNMAEASRDKGIVLRLSVASGSISRFPPIVWSWLQ